MLRRSRNRREHRMTRKTATRRCELDERLTAVIQKRDVDEWPWLLEIPHNRWHCVVLEERE